MKKQLDFFFSAATSIVRILEDQHGETWDYHSGLSGVMVFLVVPKLMNKDKIYEIRGIIFDIV